MFVAPRCARNTTARGCLTCTLWRAHQESPDPEKWRHERFWSERGWGEEDQAGEGQERGAHLLTTRPVSCWSRCLVGKERTKQGKHTLWVPGAWGAAKSKAWDRMNSVPEKLLPFLFKHTHVSDKTQVLHPQPLRHQWRRGVAACWLVYYFSGWLSNAMFIIIIIN